MSEDFRALLAPAFWAAFIWWLIVWRVQKSTKHLARIAAETRRTRRRMALWDAQAHEWRKLRSQWRSRTRRAH